MERRLSAPNLAFIDTPNFRQRVISALVLVPVTLGAVYCGGRVFLLLGVVVLGLALREWLRLVDPQVPRVLAVFAYLSLACVMAVANWYSATLAFILAAALTLILFLVEGRVYKRAHADWLAFGLLYLAGCGLSFLYLRAIPGSGMNLVVYLLLVVWGMDIGAYLTGRVVGGPKLMPQISPNKTWAGLFGGMALAAILGYAAAAGFGARQPLTALGLAIVLGPVAQWGDFFKSYFKRRAGVKESGGLIPGHGGVLDRIDGLIPASIFLALFHDAVGNSINWW